LTTEGEVERAFDPAQDLPERVEGRLAGGGLRAFRVCGVRHRPTRGPILQFDLHAAIVAPAGHARRLERLCRYALRPPVAEDRLQVTSDEHVVLRLRHRWSDGTTHVVFEPTGFLERLAVITPRPRIRFVVYYGLLAPRSSWRDAVVRAGGRRRDPTAQRTPGRAAGASDPPTASWAHRPRRSV